MSYRQPWERKQNEAGNFRGPDYPWNKDETENLYQAFKERLMAELAAVKPAGTAVYVAGVEVRYLPLVDKEQL